MHSMLAPTACAPVAFIGLPLSSIPIYSQTSFFCASGRKISGRSAGCMAVREQNGSRKIPGEIQTSTRSERRSCLKEPNATRARRRALQVLDLPDVQTVLPSTSRKDPATTPFRVASSTVKDLVSSRRKFLTNVLVWFTVSWSFSQIFPSLATEHFPAQQVPSRSFALMCVRTSHTHTQTHIRARKYTSAHTQTHRHRHTHTRIYRHRQGHT